MRIFRINPHASRPEVERGTIIIKFCGMGLDGRRRDALLPANDLRWLSTGLLFQQPTPRLQLRTPYDLAAKKIFSVEWANEQPDCLVIGLFNYRLDSVHLPHNTPIALFYPLFDAPFTLETLDGLQPASRAEQKERP